MAAALRELPGNPSSVHAAGRAARAAIEAARAEVAALIGAAVETIVFTSGGTEGNDLAIRGLLRARARLGRPGARRVVAARAPVGAGGARGGGRRADAGRGRPRRTIASGGLRAALRADTALVTLATANHELGNVYDVAALAALAHEVGALFHTDAVQAAGSSRSTSRRWGRRADAVGAQASWPERDRGRLLARRRAVRAADRGGTPGARAPRRDRERRRDRRLRRRGPARRAELRAEAARLAALRDRLETALLAIPGARRHGDAAARLPGTLNVGFAGAPGQRLAAALDLEGICVSTGAACTSGSLSPSPVLLGPGDAARAGRRGAPLRARA